MSSFIYLSVFLLKHLHDLFQTFSNCFTFIRSECVCMCVCVLVHSSAFLPWSPDFDEPGITLCFGSHREASTAHMLYLGIFMQSCVCVSVCVCACVCVYECVCVSVCV